MKKIFLLFSGIFIFSTGPLFAQRNCASHEVLQEQMKTDPLFAIKLIEKEKKYNDYIRQNRGPFAQRQATISIPVVVHVVYNTAEQNISDEQVQSQIDVLNEDFTATNKDYHKYDAGYTAVKGDADIQFCLVQVIHQATNKKSFGTSDQMKKAKTGGSEAVDPMHLLNIWVCNLGQNLLGYAYYPGVRPDIFGVVCHYKAFGRGAQYNLFSEYNLGRTTTHELGHCFGLVHIWGDSNCGNDLVGDTPLHNGPNFGCPEQGIRSTCTGTPVQMWMDYMDYTDDPCMYFFSDGQVDRANFFIDSDPQLQSIVNSGACNEHKNNQPVTVTNPGTFTPVLRLNQNQFSVFPNPANANITIELPAAYNGITEISVFNQSGILMQKQSWLTGKGINTKQINTGHLPNGIYLLQLNQGQLRWTQKIIIQH